MQLVIVCVISVMILFLGGCQPDTARQDGNEKATAQALADEVRAAMTQPSIMQLEHDPSGKGTLRSYRQKEAALPVFRKLVACGASATEPLWGLLTDDDESVRQSCAALMSTIGGSYDSDGKPFEAQTILGLNIPVLERALQSSDSQVRYFACAGLGNCADRSACLTRLQRSLPLICELRNDEIREVRGIAWTACLGILGAISTQGENDEVRSAAANEWDQLKAEGTW